MKIQELLDGIRKKDLVLPEFQREYVWGRGRPSSFLFPWRKVIRSAVFCFGRLINPLS